MTRDRFAVRWERAGDDQLPWVRESMHFPGQVTPLEADLMFAARDAGAAAAIEAYGLPAVAIHSRRINTYVYEAYELVVTDERDMERRVAAASERIVTVARDLASYWEHTLLPEVEGHLAAMRLVAPDVLSTAALLDRLDAAATRHTRLGEIHHLAVIPSYIVLGEFEETFRTLPGEHEPLAAWELLAGIPNKTVEAGQELWRVGRLAKASPAALEALGAETVPGVWAALKAAPGGDELGCALRDYLAGYGALGDTCGIGHAPWAEDPTPVFRSVRLSASQPDSEAPDQRLTTAARRREEAIAGARSRLRDYPGPAREAFDVLLSAAHAAVRISEDHAFYIDFQAAALLREWILAVGGRLAADGVLARPQDVFLLRRSELAALRAGRRDADLHALTAERSAELKRHAASDPPPTLGGDPVALPEGPLSRFLEKFYGVPVGEPAPGPVLRGTAASAGNASGTARVIASMADAERLLPGDVLVCTTIAPPWTPMFARAAAVVTDTGGVLSHGAIVAREYGIPAVVATGIGTRAIADGQWVDVDGTEGVVRIGDPVTDRQARPDVLRPETAAG